MKKTSKAKGVVETLLVIGLILLIPLFFVIRTAANQAAKPTQMPPIPTIEITNENEAAKGKQPPACTFPLAQTTVQESTPEAYTFSEPQVVQANLSNIYEIIEWLPDNQRVLITQTHQDVNYQSIDLLNPKTGEVVVYATRTTVLGDPIWVPGLEAVIYPFTNLIGVDPNNPHALIPPYHQKRQLWLSRGNPANAQLLENAEMTLDYASVFSIAARPGGGEIIYLANADKYPYRRKVLKASLEAAQTVSLDLIQTSYRRTSSSVPVSYQMAWRPNTSQVFLYSNGGYGHYTFILNVESGQICEINLVGKTAASQMAVDLFPRWSPNGRYLAVVTVGGFVVLDMATGQLHGMDGNQIIPTETKDVLSMNDIAWAPDNRHLAVTVQVVDYSVLPGEDYVKLRGLYLVDFLSHQAIQVSSTIKLGTNFGATGLLWSGNGSQLLIKCAAGEGLCLFSIHKTIQP